MVRERESEGRRASSGEGREESSTDFYREGEGRGRQGGEEKQWPAINGHNGGRFSHNGEREVGEGEEEMAAVFGAGRGGDAARGRGAVGARRARCGLRRRPGRETKGPRWVGPTRQWEREEGIGASGWASLVRVSVFSFFLFFLFFFI
jgi:hypothetical protein